MKKLYLRDAIVAKVDEFLDGSPDKDSLERFLEQLRENWKANARAEARSLYGLLISYVVALAMGFGVIQEGSIGPVKIADITKALIAMPLLIAYLGYRYVLFASMSMVLRDVVSRCYKALLPKAYELDLVELLAPPSVFNVQRFLRPRSGGKVSRALHFGWLYAVVIGGLLGPGAAVGHATYLLWQADSWPPALVATVGAISGIVWLRGLALTQQ